MQGHSFAPPAITDGEFRALRTWIHERAGIHHFHLDNLRLSEPIVNL